MFKAKSNQSRMPLALSHSRICPGYIHKRRNLHSAETNPIIDSHGRWATLQLALKAKSSHRSMPNQGRKRLYVVRFPSAPQQFTLSFKPTVTRLVVQSISPVYAAPHTSQEASTRYILSPLRDLKPPAVAPQVFFLCHRARSVYINDVQEEANTYECATLQANQIVVLEGRCP